MAWAATYTNVAFLWHNVIGAVVVVIVGLAINGEVGSKADAAAFRQYVEDLVAGVQKGIKAERTVEQLQAGNMLEKYKAWPNYAMQRNANIAEVYALMKPQSR